LKVNCKSCMNGNCIECKSTDCLCRESHSKTELVNKFTEIASNLLPKNPEEMFQNLCSERESKSEKMTDDEKTKLREHCKITSLIRNLGNSIRYLAVVDYASASVAQNVNLFFKKGSLVYLLEQRFYYRKSDLLKRE